MKLRGSHPGNDDASSPVKFPLLVLRFWELTTSRIRTAAILGILCLLITGSIGRLNPTAVGRNKYPAMIDQHNAACGLNRLNSTSMTKGHKKIARSGGIAQTCTITRASILARLILTA
jgi:hypothetical protein